MATWHRPTALEPGGRCGRSTRRLAPGHGKVAEKPGDVMDEAIAAAT